MHGSGDLKLDQWLNDVETPPSHRRPQKTVEPIGQRIGDYTLLELLGRGGMGEVYRARHQRTGDHVALKVLNVGSGDRWEFERRFKREMEINRSLKHPNLVRMLETGLEGRRRFMVMELIEGLSLQDHIKRNRILPIRLAIDILRCLASALACLHSRNILHRDLKPGNVLVGRDGVAKLADFGLAKGAEHTTLTDGSRVLGTLCYVSPEMVKHGLILPRSDVYSLGLMAYLMITGEFPYVAGDAASWLRAIETEIPENLRCRSPHAPQSLEELVREMLAKDPKDRPEAAIVAARLADVEAELAGREDCHSDHGDRAMVSIPSPRHRHTGGHRPRRSTSMRLRPGIVAYSAAGEHRMPSWLQWCLDGLRPFLKTLAARWSWIEIAIRRVRRESV